MLFNVPNRVILIHNAVRDYFMLIKAPVRQLLSTKLQLAKEQC